MARTDRPGSRSQVFRSAVDSWYYIVTFGAPLLVIVIAYLEAGFRSFGEALVVLGVVLIAALIPLWLLLSTRYTVQGDELRVRSGPVSKTIAISGIRSVEPSRSILSAPALSLKRLKVAYDGGQVLVSPADRDGFIRAIGFGPEGRA
ncbi:PH domain-containing protein [Marinihelvus fidelis]|nr:PH domain-containing protein [Marinihelvus fidelis]